MFLHSVSQAFLQFKEAGQEVSFHRTLRFANSIRGFSGLLMALPEGKPPLIKKGLSYILVS